MRTIVISLVAAAALVASSSALSSGSTQDGGTPEKKDEAKPKFTVSQVMKEAHKGGLLKKVQRGQASQKEKLQLLDYYVAMYEAKPGKGKQESWQELAGKALVAAAKIAVDEKADPKILGPATNCKACHDLHK